MVSLMDTHTHIISSDAQKYPPKPLGGHRSTWSEERPVDFDELIRHADAAGIERLVLVQASTNYGFDNSYVADQLAAHPDRAIGVCSVDFLADSAIADLDYWIGERGFSGVRIRAANGTTQVPTPGKGLDDERMIPVWEYLSAHKLPVCIQMHSQHAPQLAAILEQHTDLVALLDHCGRPNINAETGELDLAEMSVLADNGRVNFKVTPPGVTRAQDQGVAPATFTRNLIDVFGAEHVMWGSNFPASAGTLAQIKESVLSAFEGLSATNVAAILGGNAARIYQNAG